MILNKEVKMARLALPPGKKRSRQIIAKVTPSEHKRVLKAAKSEGLTMSEYLRTYALGLK